MPPPRPPMPDAPAATAEDQLRPEQVVAHRGYMSGWPENSRSALVAALKTRAGAVEFDVQLAKDRTPVLFHDARLERMTDARGYVWEHPGSGLTRIRLRGGQRRERLLDHESIPALSDIVALLNTRPRITVFVELKRQSVERFGLRTCVDALAPPLAQAEFSWILISFRADVVNYARAALGVPIGWVIRTPNPTTFALAHALAPDYLFCSVRRFLVPGVALPSGSWRWVVYDTSDPVLARALLALGADRIESGAPHRLLGN